MAAPLKDKTDIKIFILYLMRNIGYPLPYNDLDIIVRQDGIVDYLSFSECFSELLETGNIREEKTAEGAFVYRITEQGTHVADNLQSTLLDLIRTTSLQSALRMLSFQKRGCRCHTEEERLADGKYMLTCSILERESVLLSVTVKADSAEQLDKMKRNFYSRPEVIFRGALALLSGEMNFLVG